MIDCYLMKIDWWGSVHPKEFAIEKKKRLQLRKVFDRERRWERSHDKILLFLVL